MSLLEGIQAATLVMAREADGDASRSSSWGGGGGRAAGGHEQTLLNHGPETDRRGVCRGGVQIPLCLSRAGVTESRPCLETHAG